MTLDESWAEYAADHVPTDMPQEQRRAIKRAFFSGAQSAALAVRNGDTAAGLLQEIKHYALQIGRPHEAC